ncbi:hypothetical protein KFE25_013982 [Diacronema lutheri]|uniref:Uncharacterized protein n=1 Tax=Diacronema lutheri TaxID=2081491 RepID=A0A8J6CBY2_DIALT|nr:hypothetical protein KFE25_013982 [Diacronema lutheri]
MNLGLLILPLGFTARPVRLPFGLAPVSAQIALPIALPSERMALVMQVAKKGPRAAVARGGKKQPVGKQSAAADKAQPPTLLTLINPLNPYSWFLYMFAFIYAAPLFKH